MAARLGFAVAAECQPDLLLLDEVLSVGDEAFQQKCTERLREFTDYGTTMVIVTHDSDFVVRECTRAFWLHDKRVADEGDPEHVVSRYHQLLRELTDGSHPLGLSSAPSTPVVAPAQDADVALSISPDTALPIPPLEMRQLIGQPDAEAFDNPTGAPIFDFVDPTAFRNVFELGCGCGRLARQLIQQKVRPERFMGIDPHPGMIAWCHRHLSPAASGFEFLHHDVYDYQLNPGLGKPRMEPFPADAASFSLVEAWSVFTHLTEDLTAYYLREVARILAPGGTFHGTWFLFDKSDGFPMMHDGQNALYVSDAEPSAAVIFDRTWLRKAAHEAGLGICRVWPVLPAARGFQWHVLMAAADEHLQEVAWPPDER